MQRFSDDRCRELFDQFRDGAKVKFIFNGKLLKCKTVGSMWIDGSEIDNYYRGCCQFSVDKEYQDGFVGLYNKIDLLKDFYLDTDGYIMVELYREE